MKLAVGLALMSFGISGELLADQVVPLHSIFSSANCRIIKPVIDRINNQSELSLLLNHASSTYQPKPAINIEVDYNKQSLIVVALGQKPTAGFYLQIESKEAIIKKQKLYLPIRVIEPDEDSVQAQVITSPCHIISVPQIEFTKILLESYADQ
jgi:hypothetical protein